MYSANPLLAFASSNFQNFLCTSNEYINILIMIDMIYRYGFSFKATRYMCNAMSKRDIGNFVSFDLYVFLRWSTLSFNQATIASHGCSILSIFPNLHKTINFFHSSSTLFYLIYNMYMNKFSFCATISLMCLYKLNCWFNQMPISQPSKGHILYTLSWSSSFDSISVIKTLRSTHI